MARHRNIHWVEETMVNTWIAIAIANTILWLRSLQQQTPSEQPPSPLQQTSSEQPPSPLQQTPLQQSPPSIITTTTTTGTGTITTTTTTTSGTTTIITTTCTIGHPLFQHHIDELIQADQFENLDF
ncbi:bromodomain-containing protein DDB_G0270170-like [Dioscorea cayenensis subsp. rotundata]|uniref:Bromodomain-containing protein DDB_G0270170-like n=1 Tax=Dioscorea cayennensis subsp. rotundata TaxID=55577 RepID=A0AB40BE09_DIOCR|nr:bromodomain-containing protein DDB_G0270170-like [Dioscorea cayenensis subsp. rotundata]